MTMYPLGPVTIDRDWPEDQLYGTPEPQGHPNWGAVDLWEQNNPNPGAGPDFLPWARNRQVIDARCWIQHIFPMFHVWDWDDYDVMTLRGLMRGHVCGVCGRVDDVGCTKGC